MNKQVANLVFAVLLGLRLNVPCTHADTIYLSNYDASTIDKFTSSGTVSVFATGGSGLNYPVGLALDNSGNLYVANTGGGFATDGTIEKFNSSGQGSVFADLGPNFPLDLAFDNQGNLYANVAVAADDTASEIDRFDSSGNISVFVHTNFPSQDYGFDGGLACDSSGNLYADTYDGSILKFNTNGVESVFASGVFNPQGLAIHGGNLYVASSDGDILKFNWSGQESVFASTNLLNQPIGIAFDSSGNLFVANHGGQDVLEFNPNGIGSVFYSAFDLNANDIAIEVPEPSSLLLAALGAVSLVAIFKRERR